MIRKILLVLAAVVVLAVGGAGVWLINYDYNTFKAPLTRAVERATGRHLTLGGDIDLSLGLTPSLVVEDLRLANASWGSRPDMARLRRLEIEVALLPLVGGRLQVRRFILIEPDILVETDARGRSNLAFRPASPPSGESSPAGSSEPVPLPAVSLAVLEIRDGRLTYHDGAGDRSHQVSLDHLQAGMHAPNSPLSIRLEGDYNGNAFTAAGEIGPLAAVTDPARPWPLKIELAALGITLKLDGRIQDLPGRRGIDLGFAAKGKGLSEVAALAGQDLPVDGPFEIGGRLQDAGPQVWRIAGIDLRFDRTDMGGDLTVDLTEKRPRIEADLASRRIDLRLLPTAGPSDGSQETPAKTAVDSQAPADSRVFSDDPLPLAALDAADARLALRVDRLRLPKLAVDSLDAEVVLQNGKLAVGPLRASVGGGTLDAKIQLARRGKTADAVARIAVDRLDMGRMLKGLEVTDVFEGRFDVAIDLKASGGSTAALMAGLDGYTRIVMGKGRVAKSLLDVVGADLAIGMLRLLDPAAKKEADTDINCCVVRFDVHRGVADATALVFDTAQTTVVGTGTVNLGTERLDLSLQPTPKQGLRAGSFGKLSLSLGELTKPFKLGGTLADPALAIDTGQAALALGKAIGGAALFGPAGIAAALVGGKAKGDENPCVAAIQAARGGRKAPAPKGAGKPATAAAKPAETNPLQQVGSAIKGLFGN